MKKFLFIFAATLFFLSFASTDTYSQDTCKCKTTAKVVKKHKPTPEKTAQVVVINNNEQTPAVTQTVTVNVPEEKSFPWWAVLIALVCAGVLMIVGASFRSRRTNETDTDILNALGDNGGRLTVKDGPYKFDLFMNAPIKHTVALRNRGTNQQASN